MPGVPFFELYRKDKPEKRLPLRRGNVLRIITSVRPNREEEQEIRNRQGLLEAEEEETMLINHVERAYPASKLKGTVRLGMNLGRIAGRTIDLQDHLPMPDIQRGPQKIHLEFIRRNKTLYVINRTKKALKLETDREGRANRWVKPGQTAEFRAGHRIRLEHQDELGPVVHTIEWVAANEHHEDTIENHMNDIVNADIVRHPEWRDLTDWQIGKIESEKRREARLLYLTIPEAKLRTGQRINPSN